MIGLKKILGNLATGCVSVGTVIAYCSNAIPTGWLLCDGSTYDASAYPQLYALLGSTTLPNLCGKLIVGNTEETLPEGEYMVKLTTETIPAHSHQQASSGHSHGEGSHTHYMKYHNYTKKGSTGYAPSNTTTSLPAGTTAVASPISASTGTNKESGGNNYHYNIQPSTGVNYIIFVGVQQ